MYLNKWACAYFISKTKYILKVVLAKKSFLPLSSSAQSSKLSFILSISASVMCHHLSSGSSQGYLSSCVGTFVSSVVISVQVEIHGVSAGSIGLSYAYGLGLRVLVLLYCVGTGQLGNVWSYQSELSPLIWHQNMQFHGCIEI